MLSYAENELVTRVGPGTPLGALMREYWLPVLLSTELPETDGAPLRVRLLGEDLIAYRDSGGNVGLLGDHCPHRGASLFFGRNEESGLRCVYHGWKFDTSGACVDMPNEPPESNFKDKIRHLAYPCAERNGLIWTYMGPQNPPPPLPLLEFNTVPEGHAYVSKRVAENNWLQALEGGIDTSHANFLHATLHPDTSLFQAVSRGQRYMMQDSHPRFETLNVEAGVLIAARRNADAGSAYWRINPFLLPFYTMFPAAGDDPPFSGHAWVPIDDERTLVLHFTFHPLRPLTDAELAYLRYGREGVDGFHPRLDGFLPPTSEPYGAWRPVLRKENNYLLDYAFQRTQAFCGIKSGWGQDSAVQEGMGRVCDRTAEHLGTSDIGVIAARRFLLDTLKAREAGAAAPGADNPDAFALRAAALLLPADAPIWEHVQDAVQARPGVGLAVI